MKKLLLVGILFAVLIALSCAYAASLYTLRSGTNLNTSYYEKGAEDNYFDYSSSKVISKFHRDASDWNAWYYPLGFNLTESDSFWGRIDFKTPINFTTVRTCGVGTYTPFALFGFFDSNQANMDVNSLLAYFQIDDFQADSGVLTMTSDSTPSVNDTNIYTPAASTSYYWILYYDSSSRDFTGKLYWANDTLIRTFTVHVTSGKTFSVDMFAISGYKTGDGNCGYFMNDWEITYFKANNGTSEHNAVVIQNQDSDYTMNLSDGTDVRTAEQTGTKTVYVWNTTAGKPVGVMDIDFDSALSDPRIPNITSATDAVVGIALFHNITAYPSEVTNWWLLVPKTIGGPYHCPLAATLSDVNISCTNVNLAPSYTEVSVGGNTYYKISNQGGGNGGSGVPEFSDFAWILAAGLGIGSFVLVRMRKN